MVMDTMIFTVQPVREIFDILRSCLIIEAPNSSLHLVSNSLLPITKININYLKII